VPPSEAIAEFRRERIIAFRHQPLRRFIAQGLVRSMRLLESCSRRNDPAKRKLESPDQPMSSSQPFGSEVKIMSKREACSGQ